MRIRVGLKAEIIVQMTLLLAAALLLGGFLLLKLLEREMLDQQVRHLSGSLELIAKVLAVEEKEGAQEVSRARSLIQGLVSREELVGWLLTDDRSNIRASSGPLSFPRDSNDIEWAIRTGETGIRVHYPPIFFPAGEMDPGRIQITVPLRTEGKVTGAMQVQFSTMDIRKRMAVAHGAVFVYSLLYGAVLVIFGVFLLGRSVIRPIQELRTSIRQIAAGRLEPARIEGPSEIEELASSFNVMVSALVESRRETQDTIRDLTLANERLKEAREDLLRVERMASVGHLAAGMAHEIGNPLAALVGYLGILQGEIPPSSADIAGRALKEAERIDRLVRDLLDYAAPPSAHAQIVDPREAAGEACAVLLQQNALAGIRLEQDIPPIPSVRIARHRLVQVLINLLLNARDAVEEGKGVIRLAGSEEPENIRITVIDNGSGMDRSTQNHIFDPFYTTKPPGKGRGLGLSVCHRIVSEAGGRLEIDSAVGQGTEVRVYLPKETATDAR